MDSLLVVTILLLIAIGVAISVATAPGTATHHELKLVGHHSLARGTRSDILTRFRLDHLWEHENRIRRVLCGEANGFQYYVFERRPPFSLDETDPDFPPETCFAAECSSWHFPNLKVSPVPVPLLVLGWTKEFVKTRMRGPSQSHQSDRLARSFENEYLTEGANQDLDALLTASMIDFFENHPRLALETWAGQILIYYEDTLVNRHETPDFIDDCLALVNLLPAKWRSDLAHN